MKAYGRVILFVLGVMLAAGAGSMIYMQGEATDAQEPSSTSSLNIERVALTEVGHRQADKVVLEVQGAGDGIKTDQLLVTITKASGDESFRIS